MEEWLIWVIVIVAIAVISQSPIAQRNRNIQESLKKSESYRKSEKVVRDNSLVALGSFIVLIVLSFMFIFSDEIGFGLISLIASFVVPLIILFSGETNEERKKIQKMFKEQGKEETYQEELIKERARLQAQKEYKEQNVKK